MSYTFVIAPSTDTVRVSSLTLLDHLARLARVRADCALTPLGLRPRHLIALTLLRDHGSGTQQALAAALQIDRTNLVGLLNELETDGLITRRRSREDRRRHIVELTDDGARRLAGAEAALAAAEDDLLSALDPQQREILYRLLQQATTGHVTERNACSPPTARDQPTVRKQHQTAV
jgi:MarR family transcriptional regulator, lower aerobic nicotinate degradation pathway regulator